MVINSPCLTDKKELAIPRQTATGKELSNSLMADSLPKTIMPIQLVKLQDFNLRLNKEIHALIDGKTIIVSEATIRNVLHFADDGGVECLPNSTIFEELVAWDMRNFLKI
ncbi:hypothetical protein Tco_0700343 [Tanacetum coccineum]